MFEKICDMALNQTERGTDGSKRKDDTGLDLKSLFILFEKNS